MSEITITQETFETTTTQESNLNSTPNTLLARLYNYTLVNSLCQGYNTLKEKNTYLKAGLETAENYTQPVLKKLDDTLHLDEKGVAILDKIENTATGITATVAVTAQTVSGYYNQSIDYYNQQKENVYEKGKVIVSSANRPVNQLLDITENLVNKILPPEMPVLPLIESDDEEKEGDVKPEKESDVQPEKESDVQPPQSNEDGLNSNPLPRIKQMGTGVSKRLQNVTMSQLKNINFRTQAQIESLTYVVDLIQYAADYIDLDGKTKSIKENVSNVHNFIEEKKLEANLKFVVPAKEIIEQQTADIKEQGIRSIVAVVSTIAHVTEVIRRQIANKAPNLSKLQEHLKEITIRTKQYVFKLNGAELSNYIQLVREKYIVALHSLIELTSAFNPTKVVENFPILTQLSANLYTWRNSLTTRFPLETPLIQDTKTEETNQSEN